MSSLDRQPVRRLAIVGSGRVGNALARAFRAGGLEVEGPLGRGAAPASEVVLLCVPDAEIANAASAVVTPRPDAGIVGSAAAVEARFVGHTSGATPLVGVDFGLHPLQTVTGADTSFEGCGCAVAGSSPEALELARFLAEAAGMEPFVIDDTARAAYHAAASIASNFVVTLEWMAERVASAAGIEPEDARRMLAPLVRQTVDNWARLGPRGALTGPVARGDEVTVARQRKAIAQAAPDLLPLFDALVEQTREVAA